MTFFSFLFPSLLDHTLSLVSFLDILLSLLAHTWTAPVEEPFGLGGSGCRQHQTGWFRVVFLSSAFSLVNMTLFFMKHSHGIRLYESDT